MDTYQKITLALSFCNIVVVPAAIFLFRYIKRWREESKRVEEEERIRVELLNNAQMALLRDRLMQSGSFFCRIGSIPKDIKDNLISIGDAYVGLGGNGAGHEMLNKIKSLRIDDKSLDKWYSNNGEIINVK